MPLTAEQKTKIKEILLKHRREVRQVVRQHKEMVTTAVEAHDTQRAEEIRNILRQ